MKKHSQKTQKAIKKSISFFPETLEVAEQKARKETNGNLSRYIQNLLMRDLENSPPLPSGRATIIEELAEQWMPTISESLKQLLHDKGLNQAEVFGRCLARLRDYLAASGDRPADFLLVPEGKCPIYAEKQRHLGFLFSQSRKDLAATDIRALLEALESCRLEK